MSDIIDLTADEPMIVDLTQDNDPAQIPVPHTPPVVPAPLVPIQGMPEGQPSPIWPLPTYPTQPMLEGRPSLYQGRWTEGSPSFMTAIEGQPLDTGGVPALRQSLEVVATTPTHSIAWRSAVSQVPSPISPHRDEDTPEKALLRQTNAQLARQLQMAENAVVETSEQAERTVEATNARAHQAMSQQRQQFEQEAHRFESVARQVAEGEVNAVDRDTRQMLQATSQRHQQESSGLLHEIANLQNRLAEVNDSQHRLRQQSASISRPFQA